MKIVFKTENIIIFVFINGYTHKEIGNTVKNVLFNSIPLYCFLI